MIQIKLAFTKRNILSKLLPYDPRTAHRLEQIICKVIVLGLAFFLTSNFAANSQTLEQTVAFILSGGFVEITQMQQLNDKSVAVPMGPLLAGMYVTTVAGTFETIDKEQCVIHNISFQPGSTTDRLNEGTYYFNNVIVEETTIEPSRNAFHTVAIKLFGEDRIYCGPIGFAGTQGNKCVTVIGIGSQADLIPRWQKAIQYLFSNFCTSAKRKRAF